MATGDSSSGPGRILQAPRETQSRASLRHFRNGRRLRVPVITRGSSSGAAMASTVRGRVARMAAGPDGSRTAGTVRLRTGQLIPLWRGSAGTISDISAVRCRVEGDWRKPNPIKYVVLNLSQVLYLKCLYRFKQYLHYPCFFRDSCDLSLDLLVDRLIVVAYGLVQIQTSHQKSQTECPYSAVARCRPADR